MAVLGMKMETSKVYTHQRSAGRKIRKGRQEINCSTERGLYLRRWKGCNTVISSG